MKLSKKIISTAATLSLVASILLPSQIVSAANSISTTMSSNTSVMPLADKIEWVYHTTEDGKPTNACITIPLEIGLVSGFMFVVNNHKKLALQLEL